MPPSLKFRFGAFTLQADLLLLSRNGVEVALGPKAVKTLLVLVEHAGQAVSKDALLEAVWPEAVAEESSLTQNIYLLRKALAELGDPIETLPRRGYRFVVAVERADAQSADTSGLHSPKRGLIATTFAAVLCIAVAIGFMRGHAPTARLGAGTQQTYDTAMFYAQQRTGLAEQKATRLFKDVIDRAPLSPYGYYGLAFANALDADYCFSRDRSRCAAEWRLAQGLLRKSFDHNASFAQAYALRGYFEAAQRDGASAQRDYRMAIRLDPSYALAYNWYGSLLFEQRRFTQAHVQLARAAQLDPTLPVVSAWLARDEYFLRNFSVALSYCRQSLAMSDRLDSSGMMGLSSDALGDYSTALSAYDRLASLGSTAKAKVLRARTLALMGRSAQARALLANVRTTPGRPSFTHSFDDFVAVRAADIAAAFRALHDPTAEAHWVAVARRDPQSAAWLAVDPRF